MPAWIAAVMAVALAAPATAAVVDAGATGFHVALKTDIAAPPPKVWAALTRPGRWWPAAHTWSHQPSNLSLDARLGGCYCEALPHGGSMRHLTVIWIEPGRELIMEGALGPMLQSGTTNRLVWKIQPAPGGNTTLSWDVFGGGYWQGGYQDLASAVDVVSSEQVKRLKAYIETGKPAG